MDWWRDKFWIILAAAIITVSVVLGLILYCVCRRLLRQGNSHLTWAGAGVLISALGLLSSKKISSRTVWAELWIRHHAFWVSV